MIGLIEFLSYIFKKLFPNSFDVGRYWMKKTTNSKHKHQASRGENPHRALEEIMSLNPISNGN